MTSIAIGALAVFVPGILALSARLGRRLSATSVVLACGLLVTLTLAASVNFEYAIISQKVASTLAFEIFSGSSESEVESTFLLFSLLNFLPFFLTGHWWAAIGTNCALVALTFAAVRSGDRSACLYVIAPAVLNFAIFALRDVVIGVLMLFLGYLIVLRPSRKSRLAEGGVLAALLISRPENVLIYIVAKLSLVGARVTSSSNGTGRRIRHSRVLRRVSAALLGVGVVLFVPVALGLEVQTNVNEFSSAVDSFFESRATRAVPGAGGGSNILDGRLAGLPLLVRYPIQLLAFFVLPFPFEIRSVEGVLAFADSLVFSVLAWRFAKRAASPGVRLFIIYAFGVAFFASNYGNLLRLRMPAYFLMAGALLATKNHHAGQRRSAWRLRASAEPERRTNLVKKVSSRG
jgi:hypothetical protein